MDERVDEAQVLSGDGLADQVLDSTELFFCYMHENLTHKNISAYFTANATRSFNAVRAIINDWYDIVFHIYTQEAVWMITITK